MIDLVAVGKKIASLRMGHSLSQDDLAARLFLSRQAISNWEVGKSAPSIDNVIELSKLFGVSFETILCLDASPVIEREHPFQGHDRQYVVREVISGRVQVDISALLREATLNERALIIPAINAGRIAWDWKDHQGELTQEEIRYLKNGGKD
jgi:transcriptional regulator with XRE-family HTH domain